MKILNVTLTPQEIQMLITALDDKIEKLEGFNLNDKSRLNNLKKLNSLLESHL